MPVDESMLPSKIGIWVQRAALVVRAPALTQRQWRVLGLVALTTIFGQYGVVLLSLALPQIQASMAIPTAQMSNWLALIRLGALPAFGLALAADRLGRRRLLLLAVIAFSLLTGATAFAPTIGLFVTFQFLVRTFVAAASILAGVMIVEEFPEYARGWGIGALSALASVGGGIAALLFALVDIVPFGWRALYAIGLLALLSSSLLYYHLPETERFQDQQSQRNSVHHGFVLAARPLISLVQAYPGRIIVLSSIIFLLSLGGDAALFYDLAYLQQAHGWQPWHISLLNLGAGFMAVLGSAYAGQLSDQVGRKKATMIFLAALPICIFGFFTSFGVLLPVWWAGLLFTSIGVGVALGTFRAELFPTSYRSTATGATAVLATLGGALSLVLHGRLIGSIGSPWPAIGLMGFLILGAPLLVLLLPETNRRTLEEIAPER